MSVVKAHLMHDILLYLIVYMALSKNAMQEANEVYYYNIVCKLYHFQQIYYF